MTEPHDRISPSKRPAYKAPEAARMLVLPLSTVRAWSFGQPRGTDEARAYKAVIDVSDLPRKLLSFENLCELHTLAAVRRHFQVPMPAVREALRYMGHVMKTPRPLLATDFLTNGIDLFVKHAGIVVNASRRGQQEMAPEFVADLARVARDVRGHVVRLFPATRLGQTANDPKAVVIDPRVAFGRPVLARGGVTTEVIHDRFLAGDSPKEMAEDFGVDEASILDAIRFENRLAA